MITSNILNRVLFIRRGASAQTGFTIENDQRQYLVTARHLFLPPNNNDFGSLNISSINRLEIFLGGVWVAHNVRPVNPLPDGTDVAIFGIERVLTSTFDAPVTLEGIIYGQEAYFLGFPYGITGDIRLHHSGPLPIVRKGIFATLPVVTANDRFYLDAVNNPGFSGSPVIFKPVESNVLNYRIAGLVSGYEQAPMGVQHASGQLTDYQVNINTGLTICYGIERHIPLIRANPIGARVSN